MVRLEDLRVISTYYFGMSPKVYKCICIGKETSIFLDKEGKEHQFYNADMHLQKYPQN